VFKSFFPVPKLFFSSAILWAAICGAVWYFLEDWQAGIVFFERLGWTQPDSIGRSPFLTPPRLYIYTFIIFCGVIFSLLWTLLSDHRWRYWSVWGSTFIVLGNYFNVQNDVFINEWYGSFFDMLQAALSKTRVVPPEEYYGRLWTVTWVLVIVVIFLVMLYFFTSHFIFRWRTAMNDYYVAHWSELRIVEGASQRIQEDTMRFARQLEDLGISFVSSMMTLVAFLPLLWVLSNKIPELPLVGHIPGSMVFVSLISASFGTILLALIGVKLPGLEFRNQRVEAAYRKELVYGEDHVDRATPPTLTELYAAVRKNYFRLYFNYMYFNVARIAYLQGATFVPLFAMGPAVLVATITFGTFQQINNSFDNVDRSFRFFATSWTDIVELLSIYKRLKAFEAMIGDEPLPQIDQEFLATGELNG
jgi:peptide/bleomycin uptake transporter